MIYEINSLDVYSTVQNNAKFIVNSADGLRALIISEIAPEGVTIFNSYEESGLTEMMQSSQWKQPCIGC